MSDKMKLRPQVVAALAAAGGALVAGTMLGWSAPAEHEITSGDYGFKCSDDEYSWVGSLLNLGAACFCIPIGFLLNLIGRKWTMIFLALPFVLGLMCVMVAKATVFLYIGRFLIGIGCGGTCVVAPAYIGEIGHKDIRGTLGAFFQLMITCGILLVYGLGAGLKLVYMTLVLAIISIVVAVIILFMPESPLYLIKKEKTAAAEKSMHWLRGKDYDIGPELKDFQDIETQIKENSVNMFKALERRASLKALLIGMGLMFFQQLSGINAVIFYQTSIFADAKTGLDKNVSTILVGVMQVIATFVATMFIDTLGRRLMLLVSACIMALSTALIGVYFHMQKNDASSVSSLGWLPVTSLCLFIIMFSIGFGPVPWIMMGELFASDIKGMCCSIVSTTNWLLAFVVTKVFVNIKDAMGIGPTFWLFSGITILGAVFVFFLVLETKGKSLNEIQAALEGKKLEG